MLNVRAKGRLDNMADMAADEDDARITAGGPSNFLLFTHYPPESHLTSQTHGRLHISGYQTETFKCKRN